MGVTSSSLAKNNPPPPKKPAVKSVAVKINLQTKEGLAILLDVKNTDTILSVKKRLFEKGGIPIEDQKFAYYSQQILNNEDTFEICRIQQEDTIKLILNSNWSPDAIKQAFESIRKSENSVSNMSVPEAPVIVEESKQENSTAGSVTKDAGITARHQVVMAATARGFLPASSASSPSSITAAPSSDPIAPVNKEPGASGGL